MARKIITEIIPLLFILLFVHAGLIKLLDHTRFVSTIAQTPLLKPMAGWIGWILPVTELVVAIGLATPRFHRASLYGSFGLMLLFTGYIMAILQFSEHVPCGCGGILQSMSWHQHLWFNIVFTLLGLAGILLERSRDKRQKNKAVFVSPS